MKWLTKERVNFEVRADELANGLAVVLNDQPWDVEAKGYEMQCERGTRYPCGKCMGCLEKKRQEWSLRCNYETKRSANAIVVTLTYNDNYQPHTLTGDGKRLVPTLAKKDLQDFVRRLGQKKEDLFPDRTTKAVWTLPIRYYGVGEYGGKTERPHYHIILWNVPEAVIQKIPEAWAEYDRSESVKKGRPVYHIYGQLKIDRNLSGKAITYVLKYLITKNDHSKEDPRAKPFAIMSKRPGIGSWWAEANFKNKPEKIHYGDNAIMAVPTYYKNKMEIVGTVDKDMQRRKDGYKSLSDKLDALRRQGYQNPMEELVKREKNASEQKAKRISKQDQI